ncbi:MAG: hypothetical protein JSV61_00225 [Anaerolineales bacterium]|nr:MAG: hypothetical protein JSV61_00225 [Anaerolineales bacterium]
MKQDRFLLGILVGIALLVVVAVGLFLSRRDVQEYGSDDTPQGVVRNYVLALEKGDYLRAYNYLHASDWKPDYDQFRSAFLTRQLDSANAAVQIGQVRETGEEAVVDLIVIRGGIGPFGNVNRESTRALLGLDERGEWKITSLPYPYWGWDWYVPRPEKEIVPPL